MRLAIAASVLLALTFQTSAQQAITPPAATTPPPAAGQGERMSAQQFAQQAWNINTFEIQAGRVVEPKVKDYVVHDYAMAIQRDHGRMSDELAALAGREDLKLPTALDADHAKKLQELTSASGQQMERTFRDQQVEGHKAAIRLFQAYANNGELAELKSWAKKSLATLQQHLDRAQALREPPGTM